LKKPILYIALFVTVIMLFIWFFTGIFTYFVLSLVIASILRPLVERIYNTQIFNYHTPRFLAILMAYGVLAAVLSLFVVLFIPLINDQVQILSVIDYNQLTSDALQPIQNFEGFLIEQEFTDNEPGFIVNSLQNNITTAISEVQFSNILNYILSFTTSFFIGLLAIVFITFFLLYEKGLLRKSIISMIPNQYFEVSIAALNKIERLLSNYLLGLLFQMFSIFSIAAVGLALMNVKYALTIALFAAVANLIPYAGPILGSTFGIIVGLSTTGDLASTNDYFVMIAKIISVFTIVQLTDNIVLQPLIFSKSVKVHPLEIFVIIFAGASLAGIPGMIAAIPTYTILRVSVVELMRGYKQYYIFRT